MNELGREGTSVLNGPGKMARWLRLYHKHIASLFNRSLY